MSHKAFTILEILIVITIISVLIGLVLFSLKRSIDLAKQTTCCNNQRQIYLATTVYLNSGGYFELNDSGTLSINDCISIDIVDIPKIRRCPKDTSESFASYNIHRYAFNMLSIRRPPNFMDYNEKALKDIEAFHNTYSVVTYIDGRQIIVND